MRIMKLVPAILTLICCLCGLKLAAQNADSTVRKKDSTRLGFVERMQAFAKREAQESIEDFKTDKATLEQKKALEDIKKNIQKGKIYLKHGIDTLGVTAELTEINQNFKTAGDGVFTNKGTAHTFRNLTATANILNQLLNKALARKLRLDMHQQQLNTFRYELDSLLSTPAIFKFPTDSADLRTYIKQLTVVAYEAHPVDSTLKKASGDVLSLLNNVNLTIFKVQSSLDEIAHHKSDLALSSYKREFPDIWSPAGYARPFSEVLTQARQKAVLTLFFFLANNKGKLFIMIVLIVMASIYLRSLKSIYIEKNLLTESLDGQLVLRYPAFAAILIIINLYQFVFISPPFTISVVFWVISGLSLSLLFRKFIEPYWMKVWLGMFFLFILSSVDNLVLQASRPERWFMLFTALTGCIAGLNILRKGNRENLREKWIVYSIGLMVLLEVFSAMANVFGRYNLGKSLLISGYMNVVIAIVFLWTVRLINEGLFLAYNVYTKQDKKLFYLNFDRVGQRAPALFYVALVFSWLILLGRNFPAFEYMMRPLRDFFSDDRTLGDYTFTINNLILFIAIMGVSVIVSRIVSFFASDHGTSTDRSETHASEGIGSWLLLVRIGILSIGLFLALAASGIPIDKLTIVLGALGVGIGFGLQTLVNNLVSGLIIAFEKPVNVGDVVDIGGQGGTMKSIGFRSSVITTWDGADLIMPNGDLLSTHLSNWTLAGGRKRTVITVGVAYDSDLQKVRQIATAVLDAEDRLTKHPHYAIQYGQFSPIAIELRIYFWTKVLKDASEVKSDLIIALTDAFRTNKICIPVQQHDIHIQDDHPANG